MESLDDRLYNKLTEGNFLTNEQATKALGEARDSGRPFREVLATGYVPPETLSTVLSFILKVPVVDLSSFRIQPDALKLIPYDIARERKVLPLTLEGETLGVAMEDPQDVESIDYLTHLTIKRVRPVLSLKGGPSEYIDRAYQR